MELTDLATREQWRALEEKVAETYGVCANIYDTKGYRITDFHNFPSPLCEQIKAIDKGQTYICSVAHSNVAALAKNAKEARVEECDAGFVKVVVPLFVEDEFVGAFGGCGVLPEDGEVDDFMVHMTTEMPEDKIAALAKKSAYISSGKLKEMVAFITRELDRIVNARS